MPVNATFGDTTWTTLQGYRIRAVFDPQGGIASRFHVYLVSSVASEFQLPEIGFPDDSGLLVGDLSIKSADQKFDYSFKKITLKQVVSEVSRRRRVQICEFQMREGDKKELINLTHSGSDAVKSDARLGSDYQAGVTDDPEELLGFQSVINEQGPMFSFVMRRSAKNSWVATAIELDDVKKNEDWSMEVKGFSALSDNLTLNTNTLRHLVAEESWGLASKLDVQPLPDLYDSIDDRLGPNMMKMVDFNRDESTQRISDVDDTGGAIDRGVLLMRGTQDGPNYLTTKIK